MRYTALGRERDFLCKLIELREMTVFVPLEASKTLAMNQVFTVGKNCS